MSLIDEPDYPPPHSNARPTSVVRPEEGVVQCCDGRLIDEPPKGGVSERLSGPVWQPKGLVTHSLREALKA